MERLRSQIVWILILVFMCNCSSITQKRNEQEAKKATADSLMERSYALFDSCQYQEAILVGKEALKAYEAIKDSAGLSDCHSQLSFCYMRSDNIKSCIEHTLRGLRIDSLRNDRGRIGSDYSNLASLYLTANDPQRALEFIHKAIEMEESLGVPKKLSTRYGMACEILTQLDSTDLALDYIQKAYSLDSANNDTISMARRLSQKGDALSVANQYAKAESAYKKSNILLEAKNALPSLCLNHKRLSILYKKMNRKADSRKHLDKCTDIASHIDDKNILKQTLKALSALEPKDPQTDKQ